MPYIPYEGQEGYGYDVSDVSPSRMGPLSTISDATRRPDFGPNRVARSEGPRVGPLSTIGNAWHGPYFRDRPAESQGLAILLRE